MGKRGYVEYHKLVSECDRLFNLVVSLPYPSKARTKAHDEYQQKLKERDAEAMRIYNSK